jgi:hypothetical protein
MPKRITARDAMLAAHIQYELAQYAPEQLAAAVRAEVTALYGWLSQVTVGQFVQPEPLLAALRRNLIERPLAGELVDFLQENAVIALELIQDEQAQLDAILPKPVYDRMVDNLAAMQAARQELTRQIVHSSVYSRLIANVLYHGIKSFLVSENGVTRTIPGAAAFVRLGQNALNAAAPQLEKNVDKQLLTFINDNIQQLIGDSELFLNRTLDETLIRKVGEEVWETAAGKTLAELTGAFDKQSLGGWAETASEWWLHLRTTPLLDDILQAVVRSFFLRYGKQDVAGLLARLGLTEDVVVQELQALAEPLAQQALAGGYLEQRIRARLEPFYEAYFQTQREQGGNA